MEEDYPECPLALTYDQRTHATGTEVKQDGCHCVQEEASLYQQQIQDGGSVDQSSPSIRDSQSQHGDQTSPQDQEQPVSYNDRDPTTECTNQETARESGGTEWTNQEAALESGVPALVVTQAEECLRPSSLPHVEPVNPMVDRPDPQRSTQQPVVSHVLVPVTPITGGPNMDSSPTPSLDGADMGCADLLSMKSDSVSLASDPAVSRASEEEDSRSVAASSVMSLFQRLQLDPVERDWWRSSAVGNMAAQRQLLNQDPTLVSKKDFVSGFTALHWAAKQGSQEAVDMMLRSGADVNVRSHGGYTALHLASIHGHEHIVHTLINMYDARPSVRDYHGKTAVHYWSGCSDAFTKPEPHTPGGSLKRGRRPQRFVRPSLVVPRSRSEGAISLEFAALHQSNARDALDLRV